MKIILLTGKIYIELKISGHCGTRNVIKNTSKREPNNLSLKIFHKSKRDREMQWSVIIACILTNYFQLSETTSFNNDAVHIIVLYWLQL